MRPPGAAPARFPLQPSPIGFGCARIGSFNNPASVGETRRLLEAAVDLGVTLFDTADVYGQGDSEREMGRLLRRHGHVQVVTKVGRRFSRAVRLLRPLKPIVKALTRRSSTVRGGITARRGDVLDHDFSPEHLRSAVDGSLGRLGLDTLDAVLLHSPPAAALARGAAVGALEDARRAGKIGRFGVACDDVATLDAALAFPGVSVVEIPPPVLLSRAGPLRRAADERALVVLVREVIRWRGDLDPLAAIREMAARAEVASLILGTTSSLHLGQAVRAAAEGRACSAAQTALR